MPTPILGFYSSVASLSAPALKILLNQRLKAGKEDERRLAERMGIPSKKRPSGRVFWLHAASVGEAQSALILINALLAANSDIHIVVTSGTLTSANLMESRLPDRAFHQFYPLDHPKWCESFLNHWQPDAVLWMESELWPNMLGAVKARRIPAVLVNARLSQRSFTRWSMAKGTVRDLLSAFTLILAQTPDDKTRFETLGHSHVVMSDNIKYSASPLPYNESALSALQAMTGSRPCWVYASTHDGEEALTCDTHKKLKETFPDALSIIVPRHPERRDAIADTVRAHGLSFALRSQSESIDEATDIYIADTLGELGLFYKLCPAAVIGRSFSNDGGGGHNPIEAAQFGCAVLSGPNIQYQTDLFTSMENENAVTILQDKSDLAPALLSLYENPEQLIAMQDNAKRFANDKAHVIDTVLHFLQSPFGLTA